MHSAPTAYRFAFHICFVKTLSIRAHVFSFPVGKKHIQVKELDYLKSETKTGEFVTIHSNITHVTRTSYAPGNVTQNVTVKGQKEDNSSRSFQLEGTLMILSVVLTRLLFQGG